MSERKTGIKILPILPLIILCAVVPLVVFAKPVPLAGIVAELWGKDTDYDVFSWYKSLLIIICGAVMLLMLVLSDTREVGFKLSRPVHWYFAPLFVYLLCTILSATFSDYLSLALWGFPERYEGTMVISAYIITVFYTFFFINNGRQIKTIIISLAISSVLVSIPGIFQYFDMDYFQWDAFRNIILSPAKDIIPKALYEWNAVYSTLYNPNYTGSYMAMLLPMSVAFYITSKGRIKKLLFGLLCCILFACQIGSRSRAGFLGLLFAGVILLVLLRRTLLKNLGYIAALAAAFGLIFIGMNSYKKGALSSQYERIGTELQAVVTAPQVKTPVRDIVMDKNTITVVCDTNPVSIAFEDNRLVFADDSGNKLETVYTKTDAGMKITFANEKYDDYEFVYNPQTVTLSMSKADKLFEFVVSGNEFLFVDNKGRLTKISPVRKLDLKGREYIVKGRIYIWTRTIPILLDSVFLGQGADTYPVYFPQDDYIGKLNGIGDMWILIDKPHNLYLQVGTSSGIIAMIAFLLLFSVYFIHSIKLYINNKQFDFNISAGIAFFAAFCGYAVAAFFNDSVVSVAPVFWVLLGLGIALNTRQVSLD